MNYYKKEQKKVYKYINEVINSDDFHAEFEWLVEVVLSSPTAKQELIEVIEFTDKPIKKL